MPFSSHAFDGYVRFEKVHLQVGLTVCSIFLDQMPTLLQKDYLQTEIFGRMHEPVH